MPTPLYTMRNHRRNTTASVPGFLLGLPRARKYLVSGSFDNEHADPPFYAKGPVTAAEYMRKSYGQG